VAADAQQALFSGEPRGELVAFRWTDYDVPFWARENSLDGRWNYGGHDSTQYWSLTPEAAWAELIRHENLQSEDDLDLVRKPFWIARIPSLGLVDLRQPDIRERHEVTEDDLIDDDWTVCQELAVSLRQGASRGVIAASAALPADASVTLFGRRRAIDWANSPALASTVPAARVAIGRPPEGLLPRVRYRSRPGPLGDRLF